MASLKDIRIRIKSVGSTRQITSAMKMVSAAKLRKAQNAILQIRPYAEKLHEILTNLSESLDSNQDNVYARNKELKKVLIVIITSNRGLCGAFNANVVKRAITQATTTYEKQFQRGDVSFLLIGKKANDMLKSRKLNIVGMHNELFTKLNFETVSTVSQEVMQTFAKGEYDRVDLVYNRFKNAAVQQLTVEQFLPVKAEKKAFSKSFKHDYILEPSKEEIVSELIPKSLKIQFYKALLDSHAAEHGARMTAMHKATDNATEMIRDLKLVYNKARQNAITKELLEIVAGAEALTH